MKIHRRQWLPLLLCVLAVAAAAVLPPRMMSGVMAATLDSPVIFSTQPPEAVLPIITPNPTTSPLPALTAVPEGPERTGIPFVPMRTLEPETQEEDGHASPSASLIPTITPLPMAVLPTPVSLGWAEPQSTLPPVPPADAGQVQPLDWRAGLQRVEEADARSRLQELQGELLLWAPADQLDGVPLSAHTTPLMGQSDGLLLVEALMPADLALQKLITGLLNNLTPDTIFVPDVQTLARFMDLPISAISINDKGEIATFLATNRQRLPLRVLEEARTQGHSPIGPGMYLELRQSLLQKARDTMEMRNQEVNQSASAWDLSLNMISQMLWNDDPWELSVIRMEPYCCEADWEFYAAGHHVQAVDMKTGKQYTLTTDLLSGKVIGLASEGAMPWLRVYEQLVIMRRLLKSGTEGDQLDQVVDHALGWMSRLVPDFMGSYAGPWTSTPQRQMLADGQMGWQVFIQPEDSLARQLDPESSGFKMYTVLMDNDMNLVHMYSQPQPIQRAEKRHILMPEDLDESGVGELIEILVQDMGIDQDELLRVLNGRTNFAQKLMDQMNQNGWEVTLQRIEGLIAETWLPTEKHAMQHSISLSLDVYESSGINWRVEAVANVQDSTITISSMARVP